MYVRSEFVLFQKNVINQSGKHEWSKQSSNKENYASNDVVMKKEVRSE